MPSPKDLIKSNSLISQSWQLVRQRDLDIAVKLASRLPQLNISSSYALSNDNLNFSINDFIFNLSFTLVQNIYDGGQRRLNHKLTKEQLTESLDNFNHTYLEVLRDVEQALTTEKYWKEANKNQEKSLVHSSKSLEENTTHLCLFGSSDI